MNETQARNTGSYFCRALVVMALPVVFATASLHAQGAEDPIEPLINWDLVSLEQNNQRFNGSVYIGELR